MTALSGPLIDSLSGAQTIMPATSSTWMTLIHCQPLPSFPPTPNLKEDRSAGALPNRGQSRADGGNPASEGFRADRFAFPVVAQSRQESLSGRRAFVGQGFSCVSVESYCGGIYENQWRLRHGPHRIDEPSGGHDATFAEAPFFLRCPQPKKVFAGQVYDRVEAA
jgi:hypothetical protein